MRVTPVSDRKRAVYAKNWAPDHPIESPSRPNCKKGRKMKKDLIEDY